MSEETKNAGQETEKQSETVSKKDFEELLSKFESVQSAQKGSDKKVQELTQLLETKDAEVAAANQKAETANLDKVDLLAKQLEDMNKKLEDADRTAAKKEFIANGYKLATELNVSTSLVDNYGGEPDGLEDFLNTVKKDIENRETKIKNEILANGYKPSAGGEDGGSDKWDYKKHTKAENEQHDMAEMETYYKGADSA